MNCPKCDKKAAKIHTDSISGFEYWSCKCGWRNTDDLFRDLPTVKPTIKMSKAAKLALRKINRLA